MSDEYEGEGPEMEPSADTTTESTDPAEMDGSTAI
jgi:hypothetical protein